MPGIDSLKICKLFQENLETREIPVIVMTDLSETDNIDRIFEMGAVDYLTQPIKINELLARARVHLELGQLTQKLEDKDLLLQA